MIRLQPTTAVAMLGALSALALAGCSGSDAATERLPTWHNAQVNVVSRTSTAGGVVATTSLRPDGTLETAALDLATGRRLWAAPATMAGRLPGMGVSAPAVLRTAAGRTVVASVDPPERGAKGKWNASLVVRDARTGAPKWSRPVHSTFGPQRCGAYVCLSEHTALASARMVVLDPETGKTLWKLPGISEVEWSDQARVVLLRLAAKPVLEAYELRSGEMAWQQPISQALGEGVDMSGGWSFGAAGEDLIGYVAPYTSPRTKKTSAFGLFSVRLADGAINWMRPSVVRVYPSGSPGYAPVVRPVDQQGQYGGFARLDPQNGRVLGQIGAGDVPGAGWWLAFPARMDRIGFLLHGKPGSAYDLATGNAAPVKEQRGWSFCVTDPKPLELKGQPKGFYSVAAVCEFDLATGKRTETGAAAPPTWFTGSQDGWRLWRDEKGGLHAIKDATANAPGMYG
ncbi:outer membrane protein assembly factor BamB [Thermocatellispora tengchongensis]|uniref:Outer membrane protein assembly factor BamB n=1 Tax=Thermocatellispora tengchongensis TaxID=1073253 RepID=A0A840P8B1_9ACTN|nr:PQQ-binding-like beta-propeller repeat protein [Thermocatellispora tengchongensis]MBB5134101.1 outer membrane protein assembly factor BamB [Thermocatellispora tengchongensis]